MVRHGALALRFAGWVLALLLASGPARPARAQGADPAAAEEARERRAMERYVSLLEKNPRRGTALDRVYGYHVERGTLDDLIKSYRDRLVRKSDDGAAALILGLLEFQRGQDAAAVAALRRAETARPEDPLPSYYLGQALVMVGQPEQAAEAFERAIQRKPARNDLLEIFQALGRVYQRTQKAEQALAVWSRLEALFPDDPRVQEQIATTLAEEDQPAQALPRFEALATKVRDPFRQVQLAMQAAELKVRLNRSQEALKDFEAMLGKLRPDSWLHKEVRRKIEEVFLRNDDRAGLVTYYERWTKRDPEDVEALVRLGRTLATMGRVAEAQPWYEKAIKLAPARRDLRLALIGQLAQDQKYAEAAAQYELLDRAEPGNPDTLKDWGNLVLHDPSHPPEPSARPRRRRSGGSSWRRSRTTPSRRRRWPTCCARPRWRTTPWRCIARRSSRRRATRSTANTSASTCTGSSGPPRRWPSGRRSPREPSKNARNLGRLAEVLASFGYLKEAIAPLKEAVDLEKDDFDLRMKLAEYNHRLGQFDDAEAQLEAASRLAAEGRAAVGGPRISGGERPGGRTARGADRRDATGSGRTSRLRPRGDGSSWPGISRPTASSPMRCGPPTGRSRSTADRSRPGRWRPGSASRPATWATPPTPCDASARSTAATAPSTSRASRGSSRGWGGSRRPSRPVASSWPRPRPAPSTPSSSPSSASSTGGWRRGSTHSAARCAPTPAIPRPC